MGRGPAFWPGSWTVVSPSQVGRGGVLPALVLGARGGFGGEGRRGDSWGERRRVRLLAARRAAQAKCPVSTCQRHGPALRARRQQSWEMGGSQAAWMSGPSLLCPSLCPSKAWAGQAGDLPRV